MVSPNNPHRGKTLLIVDDNENNCEMCKIYLELEGYTVNFAENGRAGLERITEIRPDLILLDIVMPVMDGHQFLTALKNDPKLKDIPVLVHSVRSDPREVVKTLQMGADDFLKKPFDVDELLARISKQFSLKEDREALQEASRELLQRQQTIDSALEKLRRQARTFREQLLRTQLPDEGFGDKDSRRLAQARKATEQVNQLLDQVLGFHLREQPEPPEKKSGLHNLTIL